MKTSAKICAASILLGVLIALIVASALLRPANSGSREIEGRPLADWVRDLGKHSELENARAVLVRQGPVIIPELLRSIRETDRFSTRLQDAVARTRLGQRLEIKRYNRQAVRTWLFFVISDIGTAAKYSSNWDNELQMAVDALLVEMKDKPRGQYTIPYKLGSFGERAKSALPTLIAMCRTDYPRHDILHALAEIGPDAYAAEVALFATNFVSSTDVRMSVAAIQALGACGSNAVAAVPQLLPLLSQSESQINAVLFALARIGNMPPETQTKLEQFLHLRNDVYSANAALALLRIDTNALTARAIVQSRLHPLVGTNLHTEMVVRVASIPEIARHFEPELRKLAAKTNLPSSDVARVALKRIAKSI